MRSGERLTANAAIIGAAVRTVDCAKTAGLSPTNLRQLPCVQASRETIERTVKWPSRGRGKRPKEPEKPIWTKPTQTKTIPTTAASRIAIFREKNSDAAIACADKTF